MKTYNRYNRIADRKRTPTVRIRRFPYMFRILHMFKIPQMLRILSLSLILSLLLAGCGQKAGAEGAGNAGNAGAASANAAGAGTDTGAGAGQNGAGTGGSGATGQSEQGAGADDPAAKVAEQLKLAWNFLTEGNYKEAILAFTAVLDIDPKNGEAYKGRADAYMGQAGESEDPREQVEYLALAAQDYDKAQQNGIDPAEMEEGRKKLQKRLTYYGINIREENDPGQTAAWREQLMEMSLSEDPAVRSAALMELSNMVIGYDIKTPHLTQSYVNEIDGPMVEFVKAHPELGEEEGAVRILYGGSIAMGDLVTAAEVYPIIVKNGYAPSNIKDAEYITLRDDGFSYSREVKSGLREEECDMFCRVLHAHSIDWSVESWTDYEYDGDSRFPSASHSVSNDAGQERTGDTIYTYEDGQISASHISQNLAPYEIDRVYSHSGYEYTFTSESQDGTGHYTGRTAYYGNTRSESHQ